jgi:hypothetical protein
MTFIDEVRFKGVMSSADSSSAAQVTLYEEGGSRTIHSASVPAIKATDKMIIRSIQISVGATAGKVLVFMDTDGTNSANLYLTLAAVHLAANSSIFLDFGDKAKETILGNEIWVIGPAGQTEVIVDGILKSGSP